MASRMRPDVEGFVVPSTIAAGLCCGNRMGALASISFQIKISEEPPDFGVRVEERQPRCFTATETGRGGVLGTRSHMGYPY